MSIVNQNGCPLTCKMETFSSLSSDIVRHFDTLSHLLINDHFLYACHVCFVTCCVLLVLCFCQLFLVCFVQMCL